MTERPIGRGWHADPLGPGRYRYWDGKRWSGFAHQADDRSAGGGSYALYGWQKIWYGRVMRNAVAFHVVAWFNCSVPWTRGHLDRLMWPPQGRQLRDLR